MSDGPHRSLPMRGGWRRVAARAANPAFVCEEISSAIIPALEQDCRAEMESGLIDDICDLAREQESSLFREDIRHQLEGLRRAAGCGIGRVFLDNVIQLSAVGAAELDVLARAMTAALIDRAARGARQVEEHYCRNSTMSRAIDTRSRIDQAISASPIEALARQLLKMEVRRSERPALRHQGLDDGVRL